MEVTWMQSDDRKQRSSILPRVSFFARNIYLGYNQRLSIISYHN